MEIYFKYFSEKNLQDVTSTGATEENIIVFKIQYTMKYKIGSIRTQDSHEYFKWCTLIRKDKNSPWLIDEIGDG